MLRTLITKHGVLFVTILFWLACVIASPVFLSSSNIMNLLVQMTVLTTVGIGLTIVMVTGEIDLSYGGTVALGATLLAKLIGGEWPTAWSILTVVGSAAVIGLITGLIIVKMRLPSFIVSVAAMFVLDGLNFAIGGGTTLWITEPSALSLVNGRIGIIPYPAVFLVFLVLVTGYMLERTRMGAHLEATGQSVTAAHFAGLNPFHLKLLAFTIAGVLYGVGTTIQALRMSGAMRFAGQDLLLPVMTVAYFGQTVFRVGRPNLWGTVLGALLVASLENIFSLIRAHFAFVPIIEGLVLVSAVSLSAMRERRIVQIQM